jgi:hypothetical protein
MAFVRLFGFAILMVLPTYSIGQVSISRAFDKQMDRLYRFQSSSSDIKNVRVKEEEGRLLWAVLYWNAFLLENDEDLVAKMDSIFELGFAEKKGSDEARAVRLFTGMLKMRMHLIQDEYFKSIVTYRKIETDIRFFLKKDSQNDWEKLIQGLYHLFGGAGAKQNLKVRMMLLFMPAPDEDKGLKIMKELATSSDILVFTEANYFLGKYYSELNANMDVGLKYFRIIQEAFPQNPIFLFECAKNSAGSLRIDFLQKLDNEIKENRFIQPEVAIRFLEQVEIALKD